MRSTLLLSVLAFSLASLTGCGLLSTPDPAELVRKIKTEVKPGMSIAEVCDVRAPKKYTPINYSNETGMGPTQKFVSAEAMEKSLTEGCCPDGIQFEYYFSNKDAVSVIFDSQGKVQGVQDLPTMGDLLSM